jgi:4-amino-4-deoxy-L-arabinose transferase-like glycosyltransferase
MNQREPSSLRWITLLMLWWLLFWGVSWEARLNMDGMTYAALAKHVLSTGDWKTLHYSSQAYSNFYQHPPLFIWSTATVFKYLGAHDWSAKILPSLYALGTLVGVSLFGSLLRSPFCGFLSGVILLTSTRFIKYGANGLLDGPLAFWLVWSSFFLWRLFGVQEKKVRLKRSLTLGTLIGITATCAFLTKGIPALIIPALFILLLLLSTFQPKSRFLSFFSSFLMCLGVVAAALATWELFGNGFYYLKMYWTESVHDRLSEPGFLKLILPSKNLLRTYWPWFPIYFIGIFVFFGVLLKRKTGRLQMIYGEGIPVLFSLGILLGFSSSGHFLEHYLVPFYPFAAIIVAFLLEKPLIRLERKIAQGVFAICVFYSLLLSAFPLHVQGYDFMDPQQMILRKASQECNAREVTRLYISDRNTGLWWGLAIGLWNTPWDTVVMDPNQIPAQPGKVLLSAPTSEAVPAGWMPTGITERTEQILQPLGENLCSRG